MLSWQVGKVKITRLVESEHTMQGDFQQHYIPAATQDALLNIPWLRPHFIDEGGNIITAIQALLVETPECRLIVDTCMGDERPSDENSAEMGTSQFIRNLNAAGWDPLDVDYVLCTHMHLDHVGWNTYWKDGRFVPTFPNARYLFNKAEYDHWTNLEEPRTEQVVRDSISPIFEAGLEKLIELNHQLTPEIRTIPSLGHTPGHVSVVIESEQQTAVITGDMTHHPCQIARPEWSTLFDTDSDLATETRKRLFEEWAEEPILVIGTHYPAPTAGHIRKDDAGYRFEV